MSTQTDEQILDAMIEDLPDYIDVEAFRAYAELIGVGYASLNGFEEAYAGRYDSDEDFAEQMADDLDLLSPSPQWPYSCIDWKYAARELMYDYMEESGYYFRQL